MSAIVRTARNTLVDIGLINLAGALVRSAAGGIAGSVAGSVAGNAAGSVAGIGSFESALCESFDTLTRQSAQSVCPPSPGSIATSAGPPLSEQSECSVEINGAMFAFAFGRVHQASVFAADLSHTSQYLFEATFASF